MMKSFRTLAVLASMVPLAGCLSVLPDRNLTPLQTATFAKPGEGDVFVFSNGTYETVTRMDQNTYDSVNNRGTNYTRFVKPIYNPKKWSRGEKSGENGIDTIRGGHVDITVDWKESFINVYRFDDGVTTKVSEYKSVWRCDIEDTGPVDSLLGNVDAYAIGCTQYSLGRGRAWRKVITYLAPDWGHAVKVERERYSTRKKRSHDLVAVVPGTDRFSDHDAGLIENHVQSALEKEVSGISTQRQGKAVDSTVVVSATFKNASNTYCRRYVQRLETPREQANYPGIRCRTGDGLWLVPGYS